MRQSIRSDKVAGMITGLFGLALAGFGAFGLAIVAMQRAIMSIPKTPHPEPPGFEHFDEMMRAVQDTFITYLPFMIAGGLVYAVAGFYIYRGSRVARRIAQLNIVLGVIWIIAYTITSYHVMQTMTELPIFPGPAFQWFTIIINFIIQLAFPAALLYILWRPAEPT